MKLRRLDELTVDELRNKKRAQEYERDHFNRELTTTNNLLERAMVKELVDEIMTQQEENGIEDELYFSVLLMDFASKLRNIGGR